MSEHQTSPKAHVKRPELELHLMRAVAILQRELGVQVRLEEGLRGDRLHYARVHCLLIFLTLVGDGSALKDKSGNTSKGRTLKRRIQRPLS